MRELQALSDRLGEDAAALMKAELRDKMTRATRGQLVYGEGPGGDVELMAATRDILELRLTSRTGQKDGTLHIRLFFSEPVELPGVMCAVMLYWKRPGPVSLEDQTVQAQAASRRLDEWHRGGRAC